MTKSQDLLFLANSIIMKPLLPIAFLLFTVSCGILDSDEEQKPKMTAAETARIIVDAAYTDYAGLPDTIRALASDGYVVHPVGTEPEVVDKQKGYYLRLIVNNKFLAQASTDGGTNKTLLDSSNFQMLYGKYRNSPGLFNAAGQEIANTVKSEGYRLFKIIRHNDIDTTYWGPLKEIPVRLELYCSDLDSAVVPRVKVRQLQ